MFTRWKNKWKVSWTDFILIIFTFAVGGSLCGIVSKKLLALTGLKNIWAVAPVYFFILSATWPLCVLTVSIFTGQFLFFRAYLKKMFFTMIGKKKTIKKQKIAIFASGAGSNAAKLIAYFKLHPSIKIALIVCNKPKAGVIEIANNNNIPVLMLEKERFYTDGYLSELQQHHIHFIVLAGFLWKIPAILVAAYPEKMLNIHPALLPKYGGKGMYGHHVHNAVIQNGETESGISIHLVNEHFDEGEIVFQARCAVSPTDNADTLAQKIHELEHAHFSKVVASVIEKHDASMQKLG